MNLVDNLRGRPLAEKLRDPIHYECDYVIMCWIYSIVNSLCIILIFILEEVLWVPCTRESWRGQSDMPTMGSLRVFCLVFPRFRRMRVAACGQHTSAQSPAQESRESNDDRGQRVLTTRLSLVLHLLLILPPPLPSLPFFSPVLSLAPSSLVDPSTSSSTLFIITSNHYS